jgi:hypothetical protein
MLVGGLLPETCKLKAEQLSIQRDEWGEQRVTYYELVEYGCVDGQPVELRRREGYTAAGEDAFLVADLHRTIDEANVLLVGRRGRDCDCLRGPSR